MLTTTTSSWGISLGVLLLVTTAAGLGVRLAESGPLPPPAHERVGPHQVRHATSLDIAGSGSNIPMLRILAREYQRTHPDSKVVVHPSIGSTGGIRAVRDGAVDIGLISRKIRSNERKGVSVLPYAWTHVVLAAHPSLGEIKMSRAQIESIYAGETNVFPQRRVIPFLREEGDSSFAALTIKWPKLGETINKARREERFALAYTDEDLADQLERTMDAVGFLDLGFLTARQGPLQIVEIENESDLSLKKELSVVFANNPSDAVSDFVSFIRGPVGTALLRRYEHQPISGALGD